MEMIPLESPRWQDLQHAYGAASGIPRLLRQLPTARVGGGPRAEPFFSLWSALCHQGDVYPASYAAVPHVVAAAESRPPTGQLAFLHLVGCIEAYRHRATAPAIPGDIESAYRSAVNRAAVLAVDALRLPRSAPETRALLGCVAALQGYAALGAAIMELEPELNCPACDARIKVPGHDLF